MTYFSFSGTWSNTSAIEIIIFEFQQYEEIQIFDRVKFSWSKLAKIKPDIKLSRNIIMNDALILLGGQDSNYQTTNEVKYQNCDLVRYFWLLYYNWCILQTFRFDIKRDRELPMKCMKKKRIDFACAILENKLFVIGGCDENLEILNTVEMWEFLINNIRNMIAILLGWTRKRKRIFNIFEKANENVCIIICMYTYIYIIFLFHSK